ncbi:S8 family serine peptidase [uncultured Hymenobacter sp.]|uniref:S8 family serine peptidase n=1 Tax=uncultured Hymenobacter sp. TaxID=170016 RepID=UPI0035CBE538
MKKTLRILISLFFIWSTTSAQQSAPAPRLLVGLADGLRSELLPGSNLSARSQIFKQLNQGHHAVQVSALNPGSTQGRPADMPAVYLIELPAGTDIQQAISDYQKSGLFRYVELDASGQGGGVQGFSPNDALYTRQWGLNNTGSFTLSPAKAGADIKMEEGWAITRGDSSVTVAIIDSGCKLDHPEFNGRIWRNRQEIADNNIDDDQNGYVDDVRGWNFVSNNNNPTDDLGHGTNVAGILGASGNNTLGYAGVNWGCKLMICKGLNAQNSGFYSWWISGIYYAVNNGARVINMSLGGVSTSQAMQEAVTYATQRGVTVVACMMNDNNSTVYYPAGLTGLVAVGSTNPDDTRTNPFFWSATSGSNFGPHISVVAPGNYIYGLHYLSNTNYNTYWGGTSQATPYVAGLVSLMLTMRPQLMPAQVKATLQATADDLVGAPTEDTPNWDQYYGHGRVNAGRALTTVVAGTPKPRFAISALQVFPNPAHNQCTLHITDTRLLNHEVQVFNTMGQLVHHQLLTSSTMRVPLTLPPGTYWLTLAGIVGIGHKLVLQ